MIGGASGLVFAFVVVLWVAYVVPLALRRYDEASKSSSVESAGTLGRVIRRATPTLADQVDEEPVAAPAPIRTIDRPAARLAARRRRRVLITLLTVLVVTCGLAVAGTIGRAVVIAPVALIVAWLVACRLQVRTERGIGRAPAAREQVADDAETPAAPISVDDEETVVITGLYADIDPGRRHVMENVPLEVDALDEKLAIAVPSASVTGEALWDPLPVTLPTYVTKPRAGRTVRTIDFGQPGAWTSGHVEGEDTELPGHPDQDVDGGDARAVGH